MNLQDDDFTLFGLPQQFALDRAALDARWRELQGKVHPDRFAAEGAAAQRVAMQWAVRVNEAYRRLKEPLSRGQYLCELRGASVDAESNTAMPPAFLIQQMEWREALDDARTLPAVEALDDEVSAFERQLQADLGRMLDEHNNAAAAAQQVRALMFVNRFRSDLARRLDAFET
ncbi:Fe-S protein assembly co-chaperone HscB [Ideonella margarita]|uniref:Co-chaperone protein HscB homolog n=1 Tax=Ideonella margarita TaxID=2984191 RepID=A0ABU9CAE7_9BURK